MIAVLLAGAMGLAIAQDAGEGVALDGNTELELELSTGEKVRGWHYAVQDGTLVLSGANTFFPVPLTLVEGVKRDGEPWPLAELHHQVALHQVELANIRRMPPSHPRPGVVAGLSFAWAGAGHAALGDWKEAAGWFLIEGVLWGTSAWALTTERNRGIIVPLAGLDLLFRGVAAGEASRRARARRRQLEVGPPMVPERR